MLFGAIIVGILIKKDDIIELLVNGISLAFIFTFLMLFAMLMGIGNRLFLFMDPGYFIYLLILNSIFGIIFIIVGRYIGRYLNI